MQRRIRNRALAGLAALALVAAACGNDDVADDITPDNGDDEEAGTLAEAIDATLEEDSASYTITLHGDLAQTGTGITGGTDDDAATTTGGMDDDDAATTTGGMDDDDAATTTGGMDDDAATTTGGTDDDAATTTGGTAPVQGQSQDLEGTIEFGEDRRRIGLGGAGTSGTPTGAESEVIIDGNDLYVPLAGDAEASWGRADIGEMTEDTAFGLDPSTVVAIHDPAAVLEAVRDRAADDDGQGTEDGATGTDGQTVTVSVDDIDDPILQAFLEDQQVEQFDVRVWVSQERVERMAYDIQGLRGTGAGTTTTGDDATTTDGAATGDDAATTGGATTGDDAATTGGATTDDDAATTGGATTDDDATTTDGATTDDDAATTDGGTTDEDAATTDGVTTGADAPGTDDEWPVEVALHDFGDAEDIEVPEGDEVMDIDAPRAQQALQDLVTGQGTTEPGTTDQPMTGDDATDGAVGTTDDGTTDDGTTDDGTTDDGTTDDGTTDDGTTDDGMTDGATDDDDAATTTG